MDNNNFLDDINALASIWNDLSDDMHNLISKSIAGAKEMSIYNTLMKKCSNISECKDDTTVVNKKQTEELMRFAETKLV